MRSIKEIENYIHINIDNEQYYSLAFTHPSYNADAGTTHKDYERLEFMGDAVLGYASADLIFNLFPEMEPGVMSKLRSQVVKTESLSNYARTIHLYEFIKTGHSLTQEMLIHSNKILEDVFEALIGAIYLDKGINRAYEFVKSFLYEDIKNYEIESLTDYKTRLQEAMQAEHRDAVSYVVIDTSGPAHDRTFTINVMYQDIVLGTGSGKSKKAAEECAAKDALSKGIIH